MNSMQIQYADGIAIMTESEADLKNIFLRIEDMGK